jgi:hypothetical protein
MEVSVIFQLNNFVCSFWTYYAIFLFYHFSKSETNLKRLLVTKHQKTVREYISLVQQYTYQWSVLKTFYWPDDGRI